MKTMKITQANLTRIMKIEDLQTRKAKLQEMCLSIGWHGGVWELAMDELRKLEEIGIKTRLEEQYADHCRVS